MAEYYAYDLRGHAPHRLEQMVLSQAQSKAGVMRLFHRVFKDTAEGQFYPQISASGTITVFSVASHKAVARFQKKV